MAAIATLLRCACCLRPGGTTGTPRTPGRRTRRAVAAVALVALVALAALGGISYAQPLGRTTETRSIVAGAPLDPAKAGFRNLVDGPGSARVLRELPLASSQPGRSARRRSLVYFAQITDIHLVDEESPARLESLDRRAGGAAGWRPQEALEPATVELAMRQLDWFTGASPHRQAHGRRAPMDLAIVTGDQADNQQYNEALWARQLIEGGQTVDPGSGVSDYSHCPLIDQQALAGRPADEARRYTGVQDYDDYNGGTGSDDFYDPNRPRGSLWSAWPQYAGLMDRAERPFAATGLRRGSMAVPTYVAAGNHDHLVQGAEHATAAIEAVATGCFKPLSSEVNAPGDLPAASSGFAVPPDSQRRFVNSVELKRIYETGTQADGHGFRFVDPGENSASGFAASYYAWDPKPGVRFISLDTVANGGSAKDSFEGNIDDPQFRWLTRELDTAQAQRKLIVVFGHHAVRSIRSSTPDEAAGSCGGRYTSEGGSYTGTTDEHGHDPNPGCDLDPRDSRPLHLGADLARLLSAHDNVLAYFGGHTHTNQVLACGSTRSCPAGGNWWEVSTSATIDWPQQQRLAEIMDNGDGTVSLFATMVDQGSGPAVPVPSTDPNLVGAFSEDQLASLSRAFSFNEPQAARAGGPGLARDRNVELIVKDPRAGAGAGRCMLATGRVSGKTLGRARLGRKRATVRRAYSRTSLRKGRTIDRFCLLRGGAVRAGFPSAKLLTKLSARQRRRVKDRAVLLLGSQARYRARGLRIGSRTRTLRRRLHRPKGYRVGANTWYLARGHGARIVFRVRAGKVREIGLADLALTAGKARVRRFLRSF